MIAPGDRQRVSCAALCRIRDGQGRYLLGLNANRLAQGKRIYSPLGGALQYTNRAVLAAFDALPEAPGTDDLRLFLPPSRIEGFRAWFLERRERETTPFRELREELVDEFRLVTELAPEDVRCEFARLYEAEATSGRQGVLTHYFHEIFEVSFVPPALRTLVETAPPDSGLRWLAGDALARGETDDGFLIEAGALILDI